MAETSKMKYASWDCVDTVKPTEEFKAEKCKRGTPKIELVKRIFYFAEYLLGLFI